MNWRLRYMEKKLSPQLKRQFQLQLNRPEAEIPGLQLLFRQKVKRLLMRLRPRKRKVR